MVSINPSTPFRPATAWPTHCDLTKLLTRFSSPCWRSRLQPLYWLEPPIVFHDATYARSCNLVSDRTSAYNSLCRRRACFHSSLCRPGAGFYSSLCHRRAFFFSSPCRPRAGFYSSLCRPGAGFDGVFCRDRAEALPVPHRQGTYKCGFLLSCFLLCSCADCATRSLIWAAADLSTQPIGMLPTSTPVILCIFFFTTHCWALMCI